MPAVTIFASGVENDGDDVSADPSPGVVGSGFAPAGVAVGEELDFMTEFGANGGDELRVLVVDDNVDIADALAALLDLQGCQVRVAHRGEAGLEQALEFEPDVVFLDIGLPGMDGYEVARELRNTSLGADIILVALTGYGQASDRQKAAEAGFDHHLVKPARLDQIREILEQV